MRVMLKVSIPGAEGNTAAKKGILGKTIQEILGELKPEAAYFAEYGGKRTMFVFVNIEEPSQIPAVSEPFFLAFNAEVEFHPAMNADDLMKAGPAIERAAKKYG